MAFAKKGVRKIELNGVTYGYKIARIKSESDWRSEENTLDERFMQHAKYYGLGDVKDAAINIVIFLTSHHTSNLFIKIYTLIVDGFMGPEQVLKITPNHISQLICKGLENGWDPNKKKDYRLIFAHKTNNGKVSVLFQIPDIDPGVTHSMNLKHPIEIELND